MKHDLNLTIAHVSQQAKNNYADGYLQALTDVKQALEGETPSSRYWVNHETMETLKKMVAESDNIVFFGGVGVSTESGIPDFRSIDGLYSQEYDYPPEVILSSSFFRSNTEEFFRFYSTSTLH